MKISIKQFFEMVTKTIAGPAATITDQDKRKAIRIFLYLDEFMMENVPEYCGDITGDTEFAEIDFGYYAAGVLDELDEELANRRAKSRKSLDTIVSLEDDNCDYLDDFGETTRE
jgi:hypothetical protein